MKYTMIKEVTERLQADLEQSRLNEKEAKEETTKYLAEGLYLRAYDYMSLANLAAAKSRYIITLLSYME